MFNLCVHRFRVNYSRQKMPWFARIITQHFCNIPSIINIVWAWPLLRSNIISKWSNEDRHWHAKNYTVKKRHCSCFGFCSPIDRGPFNRCNRAAALVFFDWPTRPNGHRWSLVIVSVRTCALAYNISKQTNDRLCRWAWWVTEFARLVLLLLFVSFTRQFLLIEMEFVAYASFPKDVHFP